MPFMLFQASHFATPLGKIIEQTLVQEMLESISRAVRLIQQIHEIFTLIVTSDLACQAWQC